VRSERLCQRKIQLDDTENEFKRNGERWTDYSELVMAGYNSRVFGYLLTYLLHGAKSFLRS